jgi:subtilisin family serine protease
MIRGSFASITPGEDVCLVAGYAAHRWPRSSFFWHSRRPIVIGAEKSEQLIVKCAKPCAGAIGAVAAVGGETTYVYDNVDAIAVSVPASRVADLTFAVGADAVRKDATVALPPREVTEVDNAIAANALGGDEIAGFVGAQPANYNYNNSLTNAAPLHAAGSIGNNVVVALIDSGTASATTALAGTVIGGRELRAGGAGPGDLSYQPPERLPRYRHRRHDRRACEFHLRVDWTELSARQVRADARAREHHRLPQRRVSGVSGRRVGDSDARHRPGRQGVRDEGVSLAGRRRPRVAHHRRDGPRHHTAENFNLGVSTAPVSGTGTEDDPFKYNALNIKVANMSLGGPTLFAGSDEEDQLTLKMLDVGITLVTSAGQRRLRRHDRGQPGHGAGSLTIGASSTPVHERVLRDLQFGVGIGALYRPFNGVQTVYFSSRGPTADGRFDPELSANGFASYTNVFAGVVAGQLVSCGAPGVPASGTNACASRIIFISGTSFSSPTVAGAAALLRGAAPSATATQTRNALALGANPTLITDGSGRIDQGAGFLDVSASLALLKSGTVSRQLPGSGKHDDDDERDEVGEGGQSVAGNLRRLGIRPVQFSQDRFTADVKTLKPGQVVQFYVPSDIFTNKLVVSISNIVREGPQNQLFGDDFFVMGVDAPTSFAVQPHPGQLAMRVRRRDTTFTIDNPQTGIVRIAVQGDWTNASRISGKVTIERQRSLPTLPSAIARIRQDDIVPYFVDIPAGRTQAVIELFWLQNWGRVPTNDLDMEILDPNGKTVLNADGDPAGGSLDSPERVVIAKPAGGRYTVLVKGFLIWPQGSSGHGRLRARELRARE